METLFGLSIQQPWIDMIIRGIKTVELRSWNVRRRGLVALHAPWIIDFSAAYFYGYKKPWEMPRGKIIAVAEISEVYCLDYLMYQKFLEQHRQPLPLVSSMFGVIFKNVRALNNPVFYIGRRMFFPLPEKITKRVKKEANLLPAQ